MRGDPRLSHSDVSARKNPKYTLFCPVCLETYPSDRQKCPKDNALLRTRYRKQQIELKRTPGIGRFHDWLPVEEEIASDAGPITYKSTELARELGLKNLYISFNGYWPEREALIKTCSFKELEALPTLNRIKDSGSRLVLASTGNTARAFAHVSTIIGLEIFIVVTESGVLRMWLPEEPTGSAHLIQVGKNCDYADCIHIAERVAALPGMMAEGGARNVARRDGMGTVMLDAAHYMKRMPDYYFQAVGSGTGGIAAWEASLRLLQDGRFGRKLSKLHLAQNLPFAPMYSAWKAGRREIIENIDMPDPKKLIHEMYDDVLSNREPPYSVGGGVYDALRSTGGTMYGLPNAEVVAAQKLFEGCEGIDILPSAGVAIASLVKAGCDQSLRSKDYILLNVTGGGVKRLTKDYSLFQIAPEAYVEDVNAPLDGIIPRKTSS
jgi:cysteate synthase